MKKVFVIAAVVAALIGLTSCDKDKLQCWEVTFGATGGPVNVNITLYVWDSQNHIDVHIKDLKDELKGLGATGEIEATYKKAKNYKNQVDCEAKNPEDWKLFQ